MKSARGIWAYIACFVVLFLGFSVGFHGVVPGSILYILAPFFSLVMMIPYVLHLRLSPRVSGLLSTLVFPLSYVAIEYLGSFVSPYGSWLSYGYTQYGNLPLLQIISVTGLWGVTFIVMWFNAVVDWVWDQQFQWDRVRKPVLSFGLIFVGIFACGGLRLTLFSPVGQAVQVATISAPEPNSAITAVIANPHVTNVQWQAFQSSAHRMQDRLLAQTAQQAEAGAKIIIWGEADGIVSPGDLSRFIRQGEKLASQKKIYLGMSLWLMTRSLAHQKYQDEVVWINPSGQIGGIYHKSKLVPPTDPSYFTPGNGHLFISQTSYGKIGIAICFDADFPTLIQQAGRAHVGLLLVPGGDWRAIDPLHTEMATFRAIENGFSLVRATTSGLSIVTDSVGHTLAAADYFHTPRGHVMVAQVYVHHTPTLYDYVGNAFEWLCIVGLLSIVAIAVLKPQES